MKKYTYFSSNELSPIGWFKEVLQRQANGLSGNLDKIWKDIYDSKWIGGNSEGWERVPYWLNGFIPLAHILKDEDMIHRYEKFVNSIIERQEKDGWICPCTEEERGKYDIWGAFLILKVLVVYFECTKDIRIEKVIENALNCILLHINKYPLFAWAKYRWFECIIPIMWLYERNGNENLKELARKLKNQGFNYIEFSKSKRFSKVNKKWAFDTHVVNLAMALKSQALYDCFLNESHDGDSSRVLYNNLMKYHGTGVGHFTGDACIAGKSALQGAELCSIAETMYSFEELFLITGDSYYLDNLERLAFNSYPATVSKDMWSHQYDQLVNQTSCSDFLKYKPFNTNSGQSNMFGLEPNFGCCTANMSQAFPLFFLSSFAKSEETIISCNLIPCFLNTEIKGTGVEIMLETCYPFKNSLTYYIKASKPVEFCFGIRIPKFIKSAKANNKPVRVGEIYYIKKVFSKEEIISVEFEVDVKLVESPNGLYHLERGSLVFAMPIKNKCEKLEYTKDGVERKYPYCDYSITPLGQWNYAFANHTFEASMEELTEYAFNEQNPSIKIAANLVKIKWKNKYKCKTLCKGMPNSTKSISNEIERVIFIPYACSVLRMTDLPIARLKK